MYLGMVLTASGIGLINAVLSFSVFSAPLWLAVLIWSAAGVVVMLMLLLSLALRLEGEQPDLSGPMGNSATYRH
jgi:hypothetical protein